MERSRSRSHVQGFSLVETLLVVAIVALLAAIALPSLIASLRSAREARAIANCRAVGSAQVAYFAVHNRFGIFNNLFGEQYLGPSFVRNVVGSGASEIISDTAYRYKISFVLSADGITLDADPDVQFRSSHRWFRYRLGRVVSGPSGGEGTLYYAPPGLPTSPPVSAYRVLS
jgi:prepilin-type N-terminal cleavage/methylation domain-containing protein